MSEIAKNENVARQRIHTQNFRDGRGEIVARHRAYFSAVQFLKPVDVNVGKKDGQRFVEIRLRRGEEFFRHKRCGAERGEKTAACKRVETVLEIH